MKPVNYNCPTCKQTGRLPNAAGKFHIISNYMCKCNGCNSTFDKSKFYTAVIHNAKLYNE
jgi:hypothetical protein